MPLPFFLITVRWTLHPRSTAFHTCFKDYRYLRERCTLVKIASDERYVITVSFSVLGKRRWMLYKYLNGNSLTMSDTCLSSWPQKVSKTNFNFDKNSTDHIFLGARTRSCSHYNLLSHPCSQIFTAFHRIFLLRALSEIAVAHYFRAGNACGSQLPEISHRFTSFKYSASHTTFPSGHVRRKARTT